MNPWNEMLYICVRHSHPFSLSNVVVFFFFFFRLKETKMKLFDIDRKFYNLRMWFVWYRKPMSFRCFLAFYWISVVFHLQNSSTSHGTSKNCTFCLRLLKNKKIKSLWLLREQVKIDRSCLADMRWVSMDHIVYFSSVCKIIFDFFSLSLFSLAIPMENLKWLLLPTLPIPFTQNKIVAGVFSLKHSRWYKCIT